MHSTKPVKNSAELDLSVMGMIPPTPSTTGVRELRFDEDLALPGEQPHLAAAIPDCESSSRVPRIQIDGCDSETETKVAEAEGIVEDVFEKDLTSSRALIDKLIGESTGASQPIARSWSWPWPPTLYLPPVSLFVITAHVERSLT